ncbi:MAG: UrcA family protein [Pseudomonadota bacterium]
MRSKVMITAGVAALAMFAMPAVAERVEDVSIAVDISQHDLSTDVGARDAVKDIHNAAKEVCQTDLPTVDPRHHFKAKDCVKRAMERAVSGTGQQTLAGAYARAQLQ